MRAGSNTVFRDVVTLALLGFVALVILLIPHINPTRDDSEEAKAPGSVIVEIRWPDGLDTDIDLWVLAPGDIPVGYSSSNGRVFNLLRDDLGQTNDVLVLNYENAYTRGVPAGEYVVNIHLFQNRTAETSIPVRVLISIKAPNGGKAKPILTADVVLDKPGQELTVFRFILDAEGRLVPASVHAVPVPLRAR